MKRCGSLLLTLAILVVPLASFAAEISSNTKSAVVFIAHYDKLGYFSGWGSGFFIDEGIVVTNKHVIESGKHFKIFATGSDNKVDLNCGKVITKADMKINLEDDVAYIRVYLDCPHGIVHFANDDPELGKEVSVLGFPSKETVEESLNLTVTQGQVTGTTYDDWLRTDAFMHSGNSGGPVVHDGKVVGVAVAKGTDSLGNFITGYFVPNSVIVAGLLYANNSTFGYTAQNLQNLPAYNPEASEPEEEPKATGTPFDPIPTGDIASNSDCQRSLGEGGQSTGYGGCKCKPSYHANEAKTTCLPGAPGYEDPYARYANRVRPPRTATSLSNLQEPMVVEEKQEVVTLPEDVTETAWYADAVSDLVEKDALDATQDFRPGENATRGEFIELLVKALVPESLRQEISSVSFDDVPRAQMLYFELAGARGWVRGQGNCYGVKPCYANPRNSINRAEAAALIARAFELTEAQSGGPRFSDVVAGAWYDEPITIASSRCILRGDSGKSTVRPADTLNRAEMVTMVQRAGENATHPAC